MKRIAALAFVCSLAVMGSGCATSGYFAARLGDAADIFTATLGVGAGVKVRVGPIQPAFIYSDDVVGLRGGRFFDTPRDDSRRAKLGRELFLPFYTRCDVGEGYFVLCGFGAYLTRFNEIAESWSPCPLIIISDVYQYNAQIEVAGGLG